MRICSSPPPPPPVAAAVATVVLPRQGRLDDEYLFEFADETFVKQMGHSEMFPEA